MQSNLSVASSELSSLKDEQRCSSFALTLLSPAKINLFFRVIKKREDGFHEISSLYQAVGLYDKIGFRRSPNLYFSCSDKNLPMDSKNLVVQAAELFFQVTGLNKEVEISLEKNIPMQAGLGGGSANAATTLFGLNTFFGSPLSEEKLQILGSNLGSDVPFFFSSGTAYCQGKGEQLTHVSLPLSFHKLTIIKPHFGLSTPLVYQHTRPLELPQRDPVSSLQSMMHGELDLYNDLEEAAFFLRPELKILKKDLLSRGFSHVVLCGSGTSFFCLGEADLSHFKGCSVFNVKPAKRLIRQWYE